MCVSDLEIMRKMLLTLEGAAETHRQRQTCPKYAHDEDVRPICSLPFFASQIMGSNIERCPRVLNQHARLLRCRSHMGFPLDSP